MINTSRSMGYDKDEFGELIINTKEIMVVQFLAVLYLLGVGAAVWHSYWSF